MKKTTVVIENSPASAVLQLWLADTFWTRLHGLMFKSQLGKNEGLWLRPCNSVHMCFMRFTLDIVYVDATGKIIKLVRHLRPWWGVSLCWGAHSTIELAAGTIERLGLQCGQYVKMRC